MMPTRLNLQRGEKILPAAAAPARRFQPIVLIQ